MYYWIGPISLVLAAALLQRQSYQQRAAYLHTISAVTDQSAANVAVTDVSISHVA